VASLRGGTWLWYCFACRVGGDLFDFARRRGLPISPSPGENGQSFWEDLLRKAQEAMEGPEGLAARLFLRARGIPLEAAAAYGAGLWRGRLLLPHRGPDGTPIGARLRRLEPQGPKYVSIRGGRAGLFFPPGPRGTVPRPLVVIIVEGELDAMALWPLVPRGSLPVAAKDPGLLAQAFPEAAWALWMDEDEAGERFAEAFRKARPEAPRMERLGFEDPGDAVMAFHRGQLPDLPQALEALVERAVPKRAPPMAWAYWAAAADLGWVEPPPFPVPATPEARAAVMRDGQEIARWRIRKLQEAMRW